MARFKSPVSRVTKKPPKEIRLPEMQTGKSTIGAGIRTSLGNTADALLELGKNTKGKNIIEGSKQVGKNTKNLISSQVRGDLYKEVMKPTVYKSKGKAYLKSKAPFLKDREVVTTTNRDSVIVRKRKILTPISIGLGGSGASIGTASYALSDKNKPQSKRLSEAAVDTALFTVSAPVGLAVALGRVNDSTQRKKQKEKI